MKDIRETMQGTPSLVDFINEQRMDEGLKDILNTLKRKFKQVAQYLFGWVARLGKSSYWMPVEDDGSLIPAISSLTAGQAFADGQINRASTVVALSRKGSSLTGCKGKPKDALKLYGSGNSLQYWRRSLKECSELSGTPINEVKLGNNDPQASYNVVDTPALKTIISAHLKNPKLPRLLIMGAPGIGKTAILMNVLDEIPGGSEYNLIVKTLSNETPENFTLPKYVEDEHGQQKATDIPKTWMPVYQPSGDPAEDQRRSDACGKGLLFIDELSRAQPQVLNVILPLINEGMFNGWKLGKGWTIVCASNRADDETSGQANIGNALSNRFNIVYYEPTVKSWEQWAKNQNYISPLLLSWLNLPEGETASGGKYFYWDPNETNENDDPSMIMCTPRSWTNAMRTLAVYADTASLEGFSILDIDPNIIGMALNTCIPREAVESFMAFLKVIRSVGNFDEAVYNVWNGKDFKVDPKTLKTVALPLAQLLITAHSEKLPSEKEMTNLFSWVVSQNSHQLAAYILDIVQNVFAGMLPTSSNSKQNLRANVFVLARRVKRAQASGDPREIEQLELFRKAFEDFFKKWNITLETVPDWSKALGILADKYGDAFENFKVDGKEAFG